MRSRIQNSPGRAICRNGLGVLAVLSGTLVLAACQTNGTSTPTVSLADAKRITAEFSGSFTPPPKSINDILYSVHEKDLKYRTCDDRDILSDQDVRNLMRAARSFSPGQPGAVSIAELQATTQFQRGNFTRAVKYLKWAIGAIPDKHRGAFRQRYAMLATYLAIAGDVTAAGKALSNAQDYTLGLRPGRRPNRGRRAKG